MGTPFWEYNGGSKINDFNNTIYKLANGNPKDIKYFENMPVLEYYSSILVHLENNKDD